MGCGEASYGEKPLIAFKQLFHGALLFHSE